MGDGLTQVKRGREKDTERERERESGTSTSSTCAEEHKANYELTDD